MDCRTAREILEVLPPGAAPAAEAELCDAVAHLEDCDDCTLAVRQQQMLDRRIGRALRDVTVPGGLKERLLEGLDLEGVDVMAGEADSRRTAGGPVPTGSVSTGSVSTGAPAGPERPPARIRRRWAAVAAVSAAVVLLAVLGWFLMPDRGPRTTLARLYQTVPLDLRGAEPFDGSFEAPLPAGGWAAGNRLFVDPAPRGSDLGLGEEHAVALYGFRFRGRDGSVVAGVLVVAPAGSIDAGGPWPESFAAGEPDYPRGRGGRQLAAWAWSSGEMLYVCLVPAERMDELRQLLNLPIG